VDPRATGPRVIRIVTPWEVRGGRREGRGGREGKKGVRGRENRGIEE
jgi:hypothetical protein